MALSVPQSVVVVGLACAFPVLALLISYFCQKLVPGAPRKLGSYECGFTSTSLPRYISEKSFAVSLYLITELAFTLLLACVCLYAKNAQTTSIPAIKLATFGLLALMLLITYEIFYKTGKT